MISSIDWAGRRKTRLLQKSSRVKRSFFVYGYRRIADSMLEKQGIHRNPKTILRIMEI